MQKFLKNLGRNVAIVGTQWGDEGKGKLVDAMSAHFDVICRAAGGANAGHTIVVNGKKNIFKLLPSGLLHKNTIGVIGNGLVLNLPDLVAEIENLEKTGLEIFSRLKISLRAHLLFNFHKKIDAELERQKGEKKLGTTHRGIGPAYADKISRIGIRAAEIFDEKNFIKKIRENCEFHSKNFKIKIDAEKEIAENLAAAKKLKKNFGDISQFLQKNFAAKKKILFEGAQAHHLDIDHGTYPFVTSSSTIAAGISLGLGIPPKKISQIIGIAKSYTTRVGAGIFPSECQNEVGEFLQKNGGEFGSVTGRPRRCGWFDAIAVRDAVQKNGIDEINLTKLDVLSGLEKIKVATKYFLRDENSAPTNLNLKNSEIFWSAKNEIVTPENFAKMRAREIFHVPLIEKEAQNLLVIFEIFPGWHENLRGRKFADFPVAAQNYVLFLEKICGAKISSVGVGPDRADLIFR